jgi:glyoxylase I family protein
LVEFLAGSGGDARCGVPWRVELSEFRTAFQLVIHDFPTGSAVVVEAVGMPEIMGFSHVDLTVSDCDRAVQWWQEVLGFILVHQVHEATYESRAMIHPSGIAVTVMTHDATAESGTFDERRVGLDHLAFRVTDRDELQRWVVHFDATGITHTGIIDTGYGPTLVFRDPDNVQLKLYVQPVGGDMPDLSDADSAEAQQLLNEAR